MAEKATTQKLIKRKKKWYTLVAPPEFNNLHLGETPAFEPESVKGRSIVVNLMTLTRDMKKQSYNVTLRVAELRNNDAVLETIKYELPTMHIRRLVKKGKEKLDHAFMIETKDNVKAMFKPMFITKAMTQNSKLTLLRKRSEEFVSKLAKEKTFAEIFMMLVSTELQKTLKAELKKIYPLSICEVRAYEKL